MSETEIPLSVPVLAGREVEYATQAIQSGWLSTGGEFITRFEEAVMQATGAAHAVACVNGTAAIHVALRLAKVRPGDAVICPALTFIATINPVAYCGAHPVFVGCDEFMNMDPGIVRSFLAEECVRDGDALVERDTGRRIAAIVPVHVFGNPGQLSELLEVAAEFDIPVVEDAAESLGSWWTVGPLAGKHTGTAALAGALSFNANKIITSGGGGMILTEDDEFAAAARHLVTTAKSDPVRFVHDEVGYNYRLTNVSAAIGLAQVETLAERVEIKKANWSRYHDALRDVRGVSLLGVPEGTKPNYWFYSLLVEPSVYGHDREWLMAPTGRGRDPDAAGVVPESHAAAVPRGTALPSRTSGVVLAAGLEPSLQHGPQRGRHRPRGRFDSRGRGEVVSDSGHATGEGV